MSEIPDRTIALVDSLDSRVTENRTSTIELEQRVDAMEATVELLYQDRQAEALIGFGDVEGEDVQALHVDDDGQTWLNGEPIPEPDPLSHEEVALLIAQIHAGAQEAFNQLKADFERVPDRWVHIALPYPEVQFIAADAVAEVEA